MPVSRYVLLQGMEGRIGIGVELSEVCTVGVGAGVVVEGGEAEADRDGDDDEDDEGEGLGMARARAQRVRGEGPSTNGDDRLLERNWRAPRGKRIAVPVRIEPKVYFAAERTFFVSALLDRSKSRQD